MSFAVDDEILGARTNAMSFCLRCLQSMSHPPGSSNNIAIQLSKRIISMLMDDANNEEMRSMVKEKFIKPLLHALYTQLHPYILMVVCILIVNISLSMLSCLLSVLFYLRRW